MELISLNLKTAAVETLVVPVCEDAELHPNPVLSALAAQAKALPEFSGKSGEVLTLHALQGIPLRRAIFLGLGSLAAIDREGLRRFAGTAVQRCIGCRLAEALIAVPAAARLKITVPDLLTALLEGAFLANHRFDRYKAEKKKRPPWPGWPFWSGPRWPGSTATCRAGGHGLRRHPPGAGVGLHAGQ